jgi:hypothetical protein
VAVKAQVRPAGRMVGRVCALRVFERPCRRTGHLRHLHRRLLRRGQVLLLLARALLSVVRRRLPLLVVGPVGVGVVVVASATGLPRGLAPLLLPAGLLLAALACGERRLRGSLLGLVRRHRLLLLLLLLACLCLRQGLGLLRLLRLSLNTWRNDADAKARQTQS